MELHQIIHIQSFEYQMLKPNDEHKTYKRFNKACAWLWTCLAETEMTVMLIWHPFSFQNVKKIQRLPGLCLRPLTEIIMSSIKAPSQKSGRSHQEKRIEQNYFLCLCFMCFNKSRRQMAFFSRSLSSSIQTLCFLYSLREKDLLSAPHITVFLHYMLQLTCVKKTRMRSRGRGGRTPAALNGIVHMRQTLSESILLWALIWVFIYFSLTYTSCALLREVNYCAEKFGPAEQKRFGPTAAGRQKAERKGLRRTKDSRL